MQIVSFILLAAALIAEAQVPGAASSGAAPDSDVHPRTEVATNKHAENEGTTAAAASAPQHLRRANVFNNGNNDNMNIIVVLNDKGRRNLSSNGQETAAEKKAAAEENKAAAAAAAASMGAVATFTYGAALYGFAASIPPGLRKKIEEDPRVEFVEDDATIQLDPIEMGGDRRRLPGKPGPVSQPDQEIPWGITRVNGGKTYEGGGKAWVIDTGIDLDHPDLNVDSNSSASFTGTSADDENGHGTHVAGIIAARNNNIGVVGVAAGAPVVSVRVLNKRGSGTYAGVIAGVDYVAENCGSSDVANMSLGGPVSQALNTAVQSASAKCPFVLAAGNEGVDAENSSPASANGENIYVVSAFEVGDEWIYWSNYGAVVDYSEPGVSIKSTWKGGGYNTISGTSMATPHLAGVLLVGSITYGGTVKNDPDGNADPIGVISVI